MAFEFRLPDIGEGVVEGEVVKWKVAEGDTVIQDQPMVEVMTDKATVEIPSPRPGRIAKILIGEGKVCAVGQVMIVIDDGSAAASVHVPAAATPARAALAHGAAVVNAEVPGPRTATAAVSATPSTTTPKASGNGHGQAHASGAEGGRVLATPATRKLARELGVSLDSIVPTGKNGRVTHDDVRGGQNGGGTAGTAAPQRPAQAPISIALPSGATEERVPFRGMRKAIAANMTRSKFTATHFTYVEEIDVTELVNLRARAKEKAAERGAKLTYLPFIIKAAVQGLKKWPSINCSLDEASQEVVYKKYYHLGIATQGPQGLAVGVVRDADKRSLLDLAREVERVSGAIRDGKATRDDLTGSTFTISSLGQVGGVLATPIINFPESAIMGVHKIAEKPAVYRGQIVARHLMNLSISTDHRIADGYDAAMFLQEVKTLLEDPSLLMMELV